LGDRSDILAWSAHGSLSDTRAALGIAGVLPTPQDWRRFLDRLLLWSGALALAGAVVFFIAYNWAELGRFARFALVETAIVLAVLGYWRLGVDRPAGQASLLVAAILLGVLLALFGQTYQTGADNWELFAWWAALIAPWVLLGRFAVLWLLWIVVANLAIGLYFQVFPSLLGIALASERQLWALWGFNTTALLAWELAAPRVNWLRARWPARLIALTSGVGITLLGLHAIFWRYDGRAAALLACVIWLAAAYATYRARRRDLFMLSGAGLAVIVLVAATLTRVLVGGRLDAASLLLIALVVIALAAALGAWIRRIAEEQP